MKIKNTDRSRQLEACRTDFWKSYKAGRIRDAFEKIRSIPMFYSEPEGFGDLIDNPADDIRPAFRAEHDGCELLRTFTNMIGSDSDADTVPARLRFLRELIREFPDWRFAINLLALMLFENGEYREAFAAAKTSYDLKENCPFGEHILRKILRKLSADTLPGMVLNRLEQSLLLDLRGFICTKPFTNFEVWRTGEVFVCCGAWVPVSIGNVFEQSADEIWNSPEARELRRSVLDGDFRYCSRSCALISSGLLMKKSDLIEENLEKYDKLWGILVYKKAREIAKSLTPYFVKNETRMAEGPHFVNLAHDYTCNLYCPSCRSEIRAADRERRNKLNIVRDRVILPLLPNIRELLLAGDGDPFASQHYRSILKALDKDRFPDLRLSVLTNGMFVYGKPMGTT
ncbi:SPASM domain-containing protein [Desulfococcaceae bacterium HSG8]|nr:SPASM domain-containing protein [Desulfococcaceae bacterium HSG8]